jgi:hypothetical protein
MPQNNAIQDEILVPVASIENLLQNALALLPALQIIRFKKSIWYMQIYDFKFKQLSV